MFGKTNSRVNRKRPSHQGIPVLSRSTIAPTPRKQAPTLANGVVEISALECHLDSCAPSRQRIGFSSLHDSTRISKCASTRFRGIPSKESSSRRTGNRPHGDRGVRDTPTLTEETVRPEPQYRRLQPVAHDARTGAAIMMVQAYLPADRHTLPNCLHRREQRP